MNYKKLEQSLSDLSGDSLFYKQLYMDNKEIYNEPILNWADFIQKYHSVHPDYPLPENSPTRMDYKFLETTNLIDQKYEVSVIVNSRYCPAFWNILSFIKVVYVLRGSATYYLKGQTIEMKHGNFLITAPDVENAIFSCNDEDIVFNILIRRSSFINAFSSLLTESGIISEFFWSMLYSNDKNKILMFNCDNDKILDHIVLDIFSESCLEKNPSNLMLKSYVMLFFGNVLRNHRDNAVDVVNTLNKKNNIPMIIKYMRENLESITLVSLSKHLNQSEAYTSRLIKKETGYTFSYLLRDMRLERAAEMLINSKLNIESISEAVGYLEASRFYKVFKKVYGMTPDSYRKHKNLYL